MQIMTTPIKFLLAVLGFEFGAAFAAIILCLIPYSELLPFYLEILLILTTGFYGAWIAVGLWKRIGEAVSPQSRFVIGLTTLLLFPLLLIGIPYAVLMHTSWPIRTWARIFAGAQVRGLAGSVSSGVRIKSIAWDDNEISDIRIAYNDLLEIVRRRELIISEIHVGKAHFVGDFGRFHEEVRFGNEAQESIRLSEEKDDASLADRSQAGGKGEWPLKLLRIQRVELADLAFKDRGTGKSFSIHSIVWTGFRAEPGVLEFGDLSADSDGLKIITQPLAADGYQGRVEVLILRPIHPALLRPIPITVDFGYSDDTLCYSIVAFDGGLTLQAKQGLGDKRSGMIRCNDLDLRTYFDDLAKLIGEDLSARLPLRRPLNLEMVFDEPKGEISSANFFDSKVTVETTPEKALLIQCRGLDPGEYFEGSLPESLLFDAVVTQRPDKSMSLAIREGSFRLGSRSFEIVPHSIEIPADRLPSERWTLAKSDDGIQTIRYEVSMKASSSDALPDGFLLLTQDLLTDPPSDLRKILAEIFHGKSVAALDALELSDVDRRAVSYRQ